MYTNWIIIITFNSLIAFSSVDCDPNDQPLYSVPRFNQIDEYLDWELWLGIDALIQAVRLRHGISPLNFNDTLSKMARQKALVRVWYGNKIPNDDLDTEGIGENVYIHPDPTVVLNGSEIMTSWYSNIEATFDYVNQVVTSANLPFLNLVGPNVREYGCGQVRSHRPDDLSPSSGDDKVGTYVVCLFYPATGLGTRADSIAINKPLFEFEDAEFNFSMTDDLRNSLLSRLEGPKV